MTKRDSILFSDIEGTLVFSPHKECINILSNDENIFLVQQPDNNKEHKAYRMTQELNEQTYEFFIDINTIELAKKIQEKTIVVLNTAARKSTLESRLDCLPGDYAIYESGGIIAKIDGQELIENKDWKDYLQEDKKRLAETAEYLQSLGWNLDSEEREYALRIRSEDNSHKRGEFYKLKELELHDEICMTTNLGHIDVILKKAGKWNAAKFLMDEEGIQKNRSYGVGDDCNDLELLGNVARPYILGSSSYNKVLDAASDNKWYVSGGFYFDGINEVLRHIIAHPFG
jgi:HAD superfamily hydrolase (TIGR01484 family)